MSTIYLMEQGSVLHKRSERLEVTKEGRRLLEVPAFKVDQVVVFGNVQLTTPALAFLLRQGIEVALLSSRGTFRGRLQPPHSKNIVLRWAQYDRSRSAEFQLRIARAIVAGKIANIRTQCLRFQRAGHVSNAGAFMTRLEELRKSTETAAVRSLRGIEGHATGIYFALVRQVVSHALDFPRRTRRPPRDPFNLLLSFAYTLLLNQVQSSVETVGLDPYLGFYHVEKYGRPALALDLMEEFRPILADALVIMLINKRVVTAEDFHEEFGQVRMADRARRRILREWSDKLADEIRHPYFDYVAPYRRCIELQVRLLAKVIQGELPEYLPFRTR